MKKCISAISTIFLVFCSLGFANAAPADLKPFFFDGCSAPAPEGTPDDPILWCDCCYEHDIAYWKGGTWLDRLNADLRFKECVKARSNSEALSNSFYLAVRAGGTPFANTTYRWGFGWPYGRFYQALSPEEAQRADELLTQYENANQDPCAAFDKELTPEEILLLFFIGLFE